MRVAWREYGDPPVRCDWLHRGHLKGLRRTPNGIVALGDIEMTEPVLITRGDVAPRGSYIFASQETRDLARTLESTEMTHCVYTLN